MVDVEPRFESSDLSGSTSHFNGSIGSTVFTPFPSVANKFISEIFVHCPIDQDVSNRLLVSFDSGTNYVTLTPGGYFSWSPKGPKKQVHIKGNVTSVLYQIIINFEADG